MLGLSHEQGVRDGWTACGTWTIELTGGTLVGMSEHGSSFHAQLENDMSEGVHSRKGVYTVRIRARSSDDGRGSPWSRTTSGIGL